MSFVSTSTIQYTVAEKKMDVCIRGREWGTERREEKNACGRKEQCIVQIYSVHVSGRDSTYAAIHQLSIDRSCKQNSRINQAGLKNHWICSSLNNIYTV